MYEAFLQNSNITVNTPLKAVKKIKKLFRGRYESEVRAWVCSSCGYMELYVKEPGVFYESEKK